MTYLVLARKYRPQTFEEVVGQGHVTRTLTNAFAQDRVHHAFLFCGPRGVGKTTAARILGKALNCKNGPTANPCGECDACTSIANGTAVDYFEMDGASNRGIDAIRELTEAVRYQPALLRKKVYVIDEVHMLTTEAFNALLKTLEEPPPHVSFVMATTEPHKVPNTILSRCQRYDFKLVPGPVLSEHLTATFAKENIAIDSAAIDLIVRESGGSVRDAMSLSDQVISFVGDGDISEAAVADVLGVADRALTESLVTNLAAGDAATVLSAVEQAIARGIGELQLARAVVRHLRNLAVAQAGAADLLGSGEERSAVEEQAKAIEAPRVRQMFERMLRACDDLGQSQEPRLMLDLAFIDVATEGPLEPLGGLIDRLGQLERKLARGGGGGGGGPARRASRETLAAVPHQKSGGGAATGRSAATSPAPAQAPPPTQPSPSTQAAAETQAGPPAQASPPPRVSSPASDPTPAPAPALGSSAQYQSALANTGLSLEDVKMWEGIIAALDKERKLSLVSLFQEAKLLEITDDAITVAFLDDGFNAERAADKSKGEEMTEIIANHVGRPMKFEVKLLSENELNQSPNAVRSLVELKGDADKLEREERTREAREHPLTKVVLDTFEASIKEIKTNV